MFYNQTFKLYFWKLGKMLKLRLFKRNAKAELLQVLTDFPIILIDTNMNTLSWKDLII